jgi:hypothetical protein
MNEGFCIRDARVHAQIPTDYQRTSQLLDSALLDALPLCLPLNPHHIRSKLHIVTIMEPMI